MGAIKTRIEGDITFRKVVGILTINELMDVLTGFYAGPQTKYVVWDLSSGALQGLTADNIDRMVQFIREHARPRAGRKTAIVASADLEYGIGRMIETLSELQNMPFPARTFHSLTEAAEWLQVPALPVID